MADLTEYLLPLDQKQFKAAKEYVIIRPKIKKLFSKLQEELKHSIDDFAGSKYRYEEFKNGLK